MVLWTELKPYKTPDHKSPIYRALSVEKKLAVAIYHLRGYTGIKIAFRVSRVGRQLLSQLLGVITLLGVIRRVSVIRRLSSCRNGKKWSFMNFWHVFPWRQRTKEEKVHILCQEFYRNKCSITGNKVSNQLPWATVCNDEQYFLW